MERPAIPHHSQETDYTCGPATWKMALEAIWGLKVEEESLAKQMGTTPDIGTRQRVMLGMAKKLGLDSFERHTDTTIADIRDLMAEGYIVAVCYWIPAEKIDHYALVHKITKTDIVLQDPWFGPETTYPITTFDENWRSDPNVATRRHRWLLAMKAK